MDNQTKLNIKQDQKYYAIKNYNGFLCIFGGGNDICIREGEHNRSDSYSNLGYTYELPQGIVYESE